MWPFWGNQWNHHIFRAWGRLSLCLCRIAHWSLCTPLILGKIKLLNDTFPYAAIYLQGQDMIHSPPLSAWLPEEKTFQHLHNAMIWGSLWLDSDGRPNFQAEDVLIFIGKEYSCCISAAYWCRFLQFTAYITGDCLSCVWLILQGTWAILHTGQFAYIGWAVA